MSLAIFDLDNTLLGGDSDYLWGQFLVERRLVDPVAHARENQRYLEQYEAGQLAFRSDQPVASLKVSMPTSMPRPSPVHA